MQIKCRFKKCYGHFHNLLRGVFVTLTSIILCAEDTSTNTRKKAPKTLSEAHVFEAAAYTHRCYVIR